MNIYDEFRHLSSGNADVLLLIDALESEQLEISQRRKIADTVWRAVCPSCPPNQRHTKDSYWGQANTKCIYWGLFGHRSAQKAAWMQEQRMRGAKLVPHFEPMPRLPQPSAMRV